MQRVDTDAMEVVPLLASVQDEDRMGQILKAWQPHTLYHAAAFKHVPLVEHNAVQGLRNNVWGTWVTAQAALEAGVRHMVLISTDKAVRPTNIMGASKRLAELAIMSLPETPTQFVGVRFGNVLGSNGSVIPKFREQIAAGGPVTVTHPDMTRYFMSIPEAAQLVLQAGLLGGTRSLYVLDMGKAVRIVELAEELIRLARGSPKAVPIVFTGLRPGEKMHEELIGSGERFVETPHVKVRRVVADSGHSPLIDIEVLEQWLNQGPPADVRAELKRWVTDFNPPAAPATGHRSLAA
jgi:FlaA1/EpsC-like NDP-sugar epimerase